MLVALLEEVNPIYRCLHTSALGQNDEVVILSSGSSSYLRKGYGGRLGKGGPYQVDYLVHNSGNGVGSNSRIELKKISRVK